MKTTRTSALAAFTLLVGLSAGHAQAHTEFRFPFKSAPYAVPHTDNDSATIAPKKLKQKTLRKSQRSFAVNDAAIIVAHHKPGYHDGLPRTAAPTVPQPDSKIKSGADAGHVDSITHVLIG